MHAPYLTGVPMYSLCKQELSKVFKVKLIWTDLVLSCWPNELLFLPDWVWQTGCCSVLYISHRNQLFTAQLPKCPQTSSLAFKKIHIIHPVTLMSNRDPCRKNNAVHIWSSPLCPSEIRLHHWRLSWSSMCLLSHVLRTQFRRLMVYTLMFQRILISFHPNSMMLPTPCFILRIRSVESCLLALNCSVTVRWWPCLSRFKG